MAKAPKVTSFSAEHYPDAPEWFGTFLRQLNSFVGDTAAVMAGGISLKGNLDAQLVEIVIDVGANLDDAFEDPKRVALKTKSRPQAVLVVSAENLDNAEQKYTDGLFATWTDLGTGQISIKYIAGLPTSARHRVTLLILA